MAGRVYLSRAAHFILVWKEREQGEETGGMLGLQLVTNSTAYSLWGTFMMTLSKRPKPRFVRYAGFTGLVPQTIITSVEEKKAQNKKKQLDK